MTVAIRPLRADDRAAWEPLWAGYLSFYRGELADDVTELTFARMTQRRDGCFGLAAAPEDGSGIVAFAHCVLHPTTWSTGPTCYLEDLFVSPAARGGDEGRALILRAGDEARERGAEILYWHTQAFNGPARSLYDTVAHVTSHVHYEREL